LRCLHSAHLHALPPAYLICVAALQDMALALSFPPPFDRLLKRVATKQVKDVFRDLHREVANISSGSPTLRPWQQAAAASAEAAAVEAEAVAAAATAVAAAGAAAAAAAAADAPASASPAAADAAAPLPAALAADASAARCPPYLAESPRRLESHKIDF
jgi:hypothetical protein